MQHLNLWSRVRIRGVQLRLRLRLGLGLAFAGCTNTKLPNTQMAVEHFSVLQEARGNAELDPSALLQRKYVVLRVPEHVEPDGTVKEASDQVVEVVQLVDIRPSIELPMLA